jgi:tRNA G18 (ribose-2'-O)-methylase SpoU
VASYVEVDDPADGRLADYRDLRDVQLRQSLEAEHGLFLAEGEKVVRRAVEAGHEVRSFLMAPRWLDGLADVLASTDAPCFVVSEELAEQVTGFHVHRGALASLARTPLPSLDAVLDGARTVVVCEDIVDHTNVGAILRSAAALGVDAVLLAPRCADPLYRRSVKVAMGAIFSLAWTRLPDWYDALPDLERRGFTTVALTLAEGAVPLEDAVAGLDRVALVLGSEGHGLSSRWEASAGRRAVIPMREGIDSLNVAAATAVACYVTMRRATEAQSASNA